MSDLRLALATDDGTTYSDEHFGSAKKYELYNYSLETKEFVFDREVINSTPEEETHGDPKKAAEISDFMKEMDVLVGFAMGPNITIMRKKFVPIISREKNLLTSLILIKKNIELITKESNKEKGEEREIIILKKEEQQEEKKEENTSEDENIKTLLNEITHPEINKSLVELGMIGSIEKKEDEQVIELKMPFLGIPIKQQLVDLIVEKLHPLKTTVIFSEMTPEEKQNFFALSKANWAL